MYVGGNKLFTSNSQGQTWSTNNAVSGYLAVAQSMVPNTIHRGCQLYRDPVKYGEPPTWAVVGPTLPNRAFHRLPAESQTLPLIPTAPVRYTFHLVVLQPVKSILFPDGGKPGKTSALTFPSGVAHCLCCSQRVYVGTDRGMYFGEISTPPPGSSSGITYPRFHLRYTWI